MMRFIASTTLTLLGNALGMLIAMLLLPNFHVHPLGFVVSVVFFTVVELIFEPFVIKLALRYMPALRGGIALVTTLVGLILTVVFTNGLSINGLQTWIVAPLVIWLSVVVAAIVLPMFLFKKTLQAVKEKRAES